MDDSVTKSSILVAYCMRVCVHNRRVRPSTKTTNKLAGNRAKTMTTTTHTSLSSAASEAPENENTFSLSCPARKEEMQLLLLLGTATRVHTKKRKYKFSTHQLGCSTSLLHPREFRAALKPNEALHHHHCPPPPRLSPIQRKCTKNCCQHPNWSLHTDPTFPSRRVLQ